MSIRARLAACILLLCCAVPAGAKVDVTLPLEGFYRPGHYMPVRVSASFAQAPADAYLEIAADGAIPARLPLVQGRADAIIPVLMVEPARRLWWELKSPGTAAPAASGAIDTELRQLAPDQRLVGFVRVDLPLGRSLFPDETVTPIRLNGIDPLPGHASCWDTLDAAVLESVGGERIAPLLAAGVTLAVSEPPLETRWKWERSGQYRALRSSTIGPRAAVSYPGALTAVGGWQADWPAPFRHRLLLLAAGICILAMAPCLLRRYWRGVASAAIALGICAGLWYWWQQRSALLERSGELRLHAPGQVQLDQWRFFASPVPTLARIDLNDHALVFFNDRAERRSARPAIWCDSTGAPQALDLRLGPALKVALLQRRIDGPAEIPACVPAPSHPLTHQIRRAYPGPVTVLGVEGPPPRSSVAQERWGTLVARVNPPD